MAQYPERIFVNGRAYVFLGPVGTAAPTDPAEAYNVALVEVGFFSDDSLKFGTSPDFDDVTSHQSDYPTRKLEKPASATVEVDLQEWSPLNFQSVYGGGTVTQVSVDPATPKVFKFSPPVVGGRQERMCVVKCVDGAKIYTLIVPRCLQTEGVSHDLGKASDSILPLKLSVLGSGDTDPFYWLTNDPSWAAA